MKETLIDDNEISSLICIVYFIQSTTVYQWYMYKSKVLLDLQMIGEDIIGARYGFEHLVVC